MGLLDKLSAYIQANTPRATRPVASPAKVFSEGLLNPNKFNAPAANRFKDSAFGLLGVVPGVGDAASAAESADLFNRGEKFAGGMAALGALPLIPSVGGMFIGKGAKTWDALKAQQAEELLKAGADPREVWKQTGTAKFADGMLRQEIPDNAAEISRTLKSLETGGYKSQPIKSIDYMKRPDGTFDVLMSPPNPQKTDDFVNLYGLNDEILDAAVPEYVRARMVRGAMDEPSLMGDFEEASRLNMPFQFEGFNAMPANAAIKHYQLNAAYPEMMGDTLVQVDPKLGIGGHFANMDTGQDVIRLGKGQQKSTTLHELQHAIQQREGWARGGSPEQFAKPAGLLPDSNVLAQADALARWSQESGKPVEDFMAGKPPKYLGDEWQTAAKGLAKRPEDLKRLNLELRMAQDPEGAYRRLAGEAEARLTQSRMNLDASQRLEHYPYDMGQYGLDVPMDQLIVRGLLGESAGPAMSKGGLLDAGGDAAKMGGMDDFKVKPPKALYRGSGSDGSTYGTYMLGKGIYSSPDKSFASKYGEKIEKLSPEDAFPRNPLVINYAAGGAPSVFMDWALEKTGLRNAREFNAKYPDPGEFVKSLGYDGVVIGDEVVKY